MNFNAPLKVYSQKSEQTGSCCCTCSTPYTGPASSPAGASYVSLWFPCSASSFRHPSPWPPSSPEGAPYILSAARNSIHQTLSIRVTQTLFPRACLLSRRIRLTASNSSTLAPRVSSLHMQTGSVHEYRGGAHGVQRVRWGAGSAGLQGKAVCRGSVPTCPVQLQTWPAV